jgi:hypothetical protein
MVKQCTADDVLCRNHAWFFFQTEIESSMVESDVCNQEAMMWALFLLLGLS